MKAEEIIDKLKSEGKLGEYIGEGKDRIVYLSAVNPNNVIKIPKTYLGKSANEMEANVYLEEEHIKFRMDKEYFPNGLARCAIDSELGVLYMQKLEVGPGSDFGIIPGTNIVRRFDLNLGG